MYACNCPEWHFNWPKLQTALIGGWSQDIYYKGAAFKNCPWCGEKLRLGVFCNAEEHTNLVQREAMEGAQMGHARIYP